MAVHLPGVIETGHQYASVRTGNTGPPDITLSNHGRKLCTLNGQCETIGVFKGRLAALNSHIDVPAPGLPNSPCLNPQGLVAIVRRDLPPVQRMSV
jgi:hypothetical protein